MKNNQKIQPQATDIEDSILGGIMLYPDLILDVVDLISKDSFYSPQNQAVYEAILELNNNSEPIDMLTVTQKLMSIGKMKQAGGISRISELPNTPSSPTNIEYNAKIIAEKKIARDLILLGDTITSKAYDETTDILELSEDIITQAYNINDVEKGSKEESNAELLKLVRRDIELAKETDGVTGIQSGIDAVDKILGGYQDTQLIIKAGRPAMGKSAHAICEANFMANKLDKKVIFFSLEMSSKELMQRIVSVTTDISLNTLKSGELTEFEWNHYNNETSALSKNNLRIIDTPGITLNSIRKIAKKQAIKGGLDIIFIDYLQLISNKSRGGNREQEIAEISRGLKKLAKELSIPVIALAQLSRSVEQRGGDKKPILSDLRESGSIEQDADVVQFLYRPEYYGITEDSEGDSMLGLGYLMIAKNRHGASKDIPMQWIGKCTKFCDVGSKHFQQDYNPNAGIESNRADFDTPTVEEESFDIDNLPEQEELF